MISLIIFVMLIFHLYHQLQQQENLEQSWQQIQQSFYHPVLWIVLGLMLVNWSIEALKWRWLMLPIQPISFLKALLSVFAGCSVAMIIPNRTGEIFGRFVFIKKEHRMKSLPVNALSGISQLVVTIVIGSLGVVYYKYKMGAAYFVKHNHFFASNLFLWICIFLCLLSLMLYFNSSVFISFITKFKVLSKLSKRLEYLKAYNVKLLLRVLFLSFFRYTIFILQYVLIFSVFNLNIELLTLIALISVFYLIVTMAPTIGMLELPIRATTGVVIFSNFSNDLLGIQVSIFVVWLINLVIPSIIGSFVIFYSIKIKALYERH